MWVLEDSIREGGRGDVCDDQGEWINASGLGAKVVPVLGSRAQRSRFAESWHAFEGDRDEFHDLGCEYV